MRQLNHKNIVELIDFKETDEYYFIVLELIPGGELFHQIVRLTYFSEDLSRHVILQVAEAVRYLHEEAGVVHRDIKPENLLFYPSEYTPSKVKVVRKGEDDSKEDEGEFKKGVGSGGIGVIKLADFGLSKIIWDSKTMTPCGTVGYTAPEIVKDERYSKSVDMWALGCVLYTVLCGFPPFYDESIEILTEKVARGQYTFLSPWWDEISSSAKDLVSRLLTVDPDRRYTIVEFLQHPWITGERKVGAPISISATGATSTKATEINGKPERSQAVTASTKEFPTPVVMTLKEVFDVSNAVHRMEEENARNQRWKGKFQDDLLEEDEEDMDVELEGVEEKLERVSVGKARVKDKKQQAHHQIPRSTRKQQHAPFATGGLFELHLEGATLIERRKRGKQHPIPPSVEV